MNDDRLTDSLAADVLGWKVAPGRFIKPDRGWTPRWQFAPLKRVEDAFLALDRAATDYTLKSAAGVFTARVRIGKRIGEAVGEHKARTITLAVARALQLDVRELNGRQLPSGSDEAPFTGPQLEVKKRRGQP